MNTLTIDVCSLTESLADAARAMETGQAQGPRYSFSSAQALMRTLVAYYLAGKELETRKIFKELQEL